MKIEKVNENQIRCTLTREDLASRELKISELAYGTEKAKTLFRDMMRQASFEFGFEAEDIPLWQVPKRWNYESVNINSNIEDLIEMSMRQNFVPVVDDEGIFIGIIRRRDIIQYCYQKSGIKEEEEARRSARKQNAEQMILQ